MRSLFYFLIYWGACSHSPPTPYHSFPGPTCCFWCCHLQYRIPKKNYGQEPNINFSYMGSCTGWEGKSWHCWDAQTWCTLPSVHSVEAPKRPSWFCSSPIHRPWQGYLKSLSACYCLVHRKDHMILCCGVPSYALQIYIEDHGKGNVQCTEKLQNLQNPTLLQQPGIQVVIFKEYTLEKFTFLVFLPPRKSATLHLRSCLAPECTLLSRYIVTVKVYGHCQGLWSLSRYVTTLSRYG